MVIDNRRQKNANNDLIAAMVVTVWTRETVNPCLTDSSLGICFLYYQTKRGFAPGATTDRQIAPFTSRNPSLVTAD